MKKTFKKLLSVLLVAVMLVGFVSFSGFTPKASAEEVIDEEPVHTAEMSVKLCCDKVELITFGKDVLEPEVTIEEGVAYTVSFTSSDPTIVTINDKGELYGVNKFQSKTAIVTCTVSDNFGNIAQATCEVKVGFAWWQWIIIAPIVSIPSLITLIRDNMN